MNDYKVRGILLYSKISSENNLYLKILSEKDEIITGLCFGGSSKTPLTGSIVILKSWDAFLPNTPLKASR